jgi:hypothetical protein
MSTELAAAGRSVSAPCRKTDITMIGMCYLLCQAGQGPMVTWKGEPALAVRGLRKSFGTKEAVAGIDLEIAWFPRRSGRRIRCRIAAAEVTAGSSSRSASVHTSEECCGLALGDLVHAGAGPEEHRRRH